MSLNHSIEQLKPVTIPYHRGAWIPPVVEPRFIDFANKEISAQPKKPTPLIENYGNIFSNQACLSERLAQPFADKERLNSQNTTMPPVEYSGDIFEKQTDTADKTLFTVSDGKKYSLKELINMRIENATGMFWESYFKNSSFSLLTKKQGINYYYLNKITDMAEKLISQADKAENIEELFVQVIGQEYSQENLEKFLNHEIKLNIEESIEKLIYQKVSKTNPVPYISKYYTDSKKLEELKQSRTELNETETKKYKTIKNLLSDEYQIKFENALKNGMLLQNKTEILDIFYKIAITKRAENFNSKQILEDCIEILDNPYIITQTAEDIPEEYREKCKDIIVARNYELQNNNIQNPKMSETIPVYTSVGEGYIKIKPVLQETKSDIMENNFEEQVEDKIKWRHLGTCAAASIEFDMAVNNSAEFFRMVEGLTSDKKTYTKTVDVDDVRINLLNLFNTAYKMVNNKAEVVIKADPNAYILSEMQTTYKDKGERSVVDILVQSAIMNLGSKQTYESISDTRKPNEFNSDNGGLAEFEVEFAKSILTDNNTSNNTYKRTDDNGKVKDLYQKEDVKNELLKALKNNGNVVAGLLYTDEENNIIGGHEITIVGYTTNYKGEGFFIVQDSDDFESKPVAVPEEVLLKQLHHAAI